MVKSSWDVFSIVDYVTLLDFRDFADTRGDGRTDGIIPRARPFVADGNALGKPLVIGVELTANADDPVTFFEESSEQMERELRTVAQQFASAWTFKGLAIHDYAAWKDKLASSPPSGEDCRMNINSGALYTGGLSAQIQMAVQGASEVLMGNDGGLGGAEWQPFVSPIPWQLPDVGPRIATLIVYARFRDDSGQPLCNGMTISDDILYDPLSPTVELALEPSQFEMLDQSACYPDEVMLHVLAADQPNGSGVTAMQIGFEAELAEVGWRPYQETACVVPDGANSVYVRVRDAADNLSETASLSIAEEQLFLPFVQR